MLLPDPFEGFSPELYVAALSDVAHSDGLHAAEMAILEEHAERLRHRPRPTADIARRSFGPTRGHACPRLP